MNPSPESLWYYADAANQPVGPLPMDVLQRLAGVGVISPETHVLEEGGIEWKKFASIVPPPACAEMKPASADIPLSSAAVPAKENAAAGLTSHGKNAEGFFQNCRRRFKALAVFAAEKSKHYRKKSEELFDAYKCGLKAQADKRADEAVPKPGGPPTEKKQSTTKETVQGCGCLVLIALVLMLPLKSCSFWSGKSDKPATIGISYSQIMGHGIGEAFDMKPSSDVDGKKRLMGYSHSGAAILETIGDQANLYEASLLIAMPRDNTQVVALHTEFALAFLANIDPTWTSSERVDWITVAVKQFTMKRTTNENGKISVIRGNNRITLTDLPPLGFSIAVKAASKVDP